MFDVCILKALGLSVFVFSPSLQKESQKKLKKECPRALTIRPHFKKKKAQGFIR